MTGIRPSVLLSFCFTMALLGVPALGQLKETYEPPGFVLEWGNPGSGDGQFDFPHGLTVDTSGNVYVSDWNNHRIEKFDSAGNFLAKWGSNGSGDGQFNYPTGVAAGASGNVYVADTHNHRIEKFDSAGNFLAKWGSPGSGDGQFNYPIGVAVDAFGYIYVSDARNHRIEKFDVAGNFLAKWGSNGSGDGQFDLPSGVATDTAGNVYVVDSGNARVQKFDSAGNFLAKWGSSGGGDGQFDDPRGVAADASGNVYVADLINHRMQKFDSAGNFLAKWGSNGSGDSQFNFPIDVAADASGNVYVADGGNDRIQKFAPVLWFDLAGYDSLLSVSASHETTAVRTLLQLENNGAPRFAFKNTSSDIEWSFQQSGPGNFLISKEGTGGPELQVYQNGRVRMGPGGAVNLDLSPNGNLTIAGNLTANGSTFPDYVFEPNYDLVSLEELSEFIQDERHLPGIPSAGEVTQQGGHNMTDLQLKLLEKIEELTLFTLEQERRLQEKESEIQHLEFDLGRIKKALDSARRPL